MAINPNTERYFALFTDAAAVNTQFSGDRWTYDGDPKVEEEFVTDAEILFASYEYEDYSGKAFVLFERDGTLFEVHGSHCSCHGLEGQWLPEETTWDALAMRSWMQVMDEDEYSYSWDTFEGVGAARALVTSKLADRSV